MPEYLAPGVYVEEVSYRSKPIEGVSTSTAAFVGATRTGPILADRELPPLITNVGQFEEFYGGPEDLVFQTGTRPNYLGHAVRAFFAEGGSRLYVVRAFQQGAENATAGADLVPNANGADRARITARFPGRAGNMRLFFSERTVDASAERINTLSNGTMIRVGDGPAGTPARLLGARMPVAVAANAVLRIEHQGVALADVVFMLGPRAEIASTGALAAPVDLTGANEAARTFSVRIDGGAVQTIVLPPVAFATLPELALALNRLISGGYVALNGAADRLVAGTDTAGAGGSVAITSATLGFNGTETQDGQGVGDLGRVTGADVNALIVRAIGGVPPVRAELEPGTDRLVLRTVNAAAETLRVVDVGAASAHGALGLGTVLTTGTAGALPTFFVRNAGAWTDVNGAPLVLGGARARVLTYDVAAFDEFDRLRFQIEDIGLDALHLRALTRVLPERPATLTERYRQAIAAVIGANVSPFAINTAIGNLPLVRVPGGQPEETRRMLALIGGLDGAVPDPGAITVALSRLDRVEDVSIVAAPGSTAGLAADLPGLQQMHSALITHAERRRSYRIAVLDPADNMGLTELRQSRGTLDSRYGALYYPWVMISNPNTRPGDERQPRVLGVPPSGHIAGIYGRNDAERGVFKAPANEVIRTSVGLEVDVSFGEQQAINPEGINALRLLPGRGFRVWGARLISSDGEWKYVSDRRYFNYLESSIDRGTQWVVFEPNGERLWDRLVESVTEFLYNEWRGGALLGTSPKEAFFVRCDRSTMTQNDLDSGRLVCEIGIALVKPAEFVIFRIGQKTADARN